MRTVLILLFIVLVLGVVGISGAFGSGYVYSAKIAFGAAIYGFVVTFVMALFHVGARADEARP